MTRWRTGTKNPHCIYLDDEPVGFIMNPELARRMVERLECFPTIQTPPLEPFGISLTTDDAAIFFGIERIDGSLIGPPCDGRGESCIGCPDCNGRGNLNW
jgi:hypothetical protein